MPPSQQSTIGIEFSWLAVDEVGHVGLFTTAGEGPVPDSALPQSEQDFEAQDQILEMRERSECKLHMPYPRPDDYVAVARRGVYAFDWADIHETISQCAHRYRLVGEPKSPLVVSELPSALQVRAFATRIPGVFFRASAEAGVSV
jgi:hypothetical protein